MRRPVSLERVALEEALALRPRGFAARADQGERTIVVPRSVRIRDGALEWSDDEPGLDRRRLTAANEAAGNTIAFPRRKLDEAVLGRFVKLATAPEDDIAAFARWYGVLYLNERGAPGGEPVEVTYDDETVTESRLEQSPAGDLRFDPDGEVRPIIWRQEPLQLWRAWSLIVRLLLLYGTELRNTQARIDPIMLIRRWGIQVPAKSRDEERWYFSEPGALISALSVSGRSPASGKDCVPTTFAEQRQQLGWWLDVLVSRSSATVRVDWDAATRPEVRIERFGVDELFAGLYRTNDVFGDIVVQLLTRLRTEANLHTCPDCGTSYPCKRRRGYCPSCRRERRKASHKATWNRHPEYRERRRRPPGGQGPRL